MYNTFVEQIFPLSDDVRIFPGHDYIRNNLEFTLDREPDNQSALNLREEFKQWLDSESFVSNIGIEREINIFFRLDQAQVRAGIGASALDDQSTFIGLRRLRDNW